LRLTFESRLAFNMDGVGEKQISFLYENGYIKRPVDIFSLKEREGELMKQERWGKKSVENLFHSIEKAKSISLNRFIYSLGIRYVGDATAKLIAKQYGDFSNFYKNMVNMTEEAEQELLLVDGIGGAAVGALKRFFAQKYNSDIVAELGKILEIEKQVSVHSDSALNNKKVVFTGGLEHMTRGEAKTKAESKGAKVLSAVSANVDYVIAGGDAGSKLKKAKELGVKILSEKEWEKLLR